MKCKICFCVCLSFLDIILNFALILLMNCLFKYHRGDQGASVEGKNNIFKIFGQTSIFFFSKHYSHTLSK